MADVIQRNIDRLIHCDEDQRERLEPMSEWKWQRIHQIALRYDIGPWIARGMKAYEDDFFLNPSPALRQEMLIMAGELDKGRLERYELDVDRARGTLHKLSSRSLRAYVADLITSIKNIEE